MSTKKDVKTFVMQSNPQTKKKSLIRNKASFIEQRTQRTTKFIIKEYNEVYIYGGKGYSLKEWRDQKKLKKAIIENIGFKQLEVPYFSETDIQYISYSNTMQGLVDTLDDVVEFDVNKAYYQTAFVLNYIDEQMYSELINLPKDIRLRFIGSIATRKRVYNYENGVLCGDPEIKENELLRRVWFHICKHVDDCMKEIANMVKDKFLMYYVDGIYLINDDYTEVFNYIEKKYGLKFKQADVASIEKVFDIAMKCNVYNVIKVDENGVKSLKRFCEPQKKLKMSSWVKEALGRNGIHD